MRDILTSGVGCLKYQTHLIFMKVIFIHTRFFYNCDDHNKVFMQNVAQDKKIYIM